MNWDAMQWQIVRVGLLNDIHRLERCRANCTGGADQKAFDNSIERRRGMLADVVAKIRELLPAALEGRRESNV